ncbi:MAG TPA: hypothetical protein VKZ93_01420, partial [Arenibacter sp.]|nr:hypothetical protein [Arenibacter sp.]
MKKLIGLFLLTYGLTSCDKKTEPIVISADDLHQSIQKVADIMIHDIFSPPVASRIFANPNIAAYEIMALGNEDYVSFVGKVNELTTIPLPPTDTPINYELAAIVAHIELSKRMIFSEKDLVVFRDSLYRKWSGKNPGIFNSSQAYGLKVADHIAVWMGKDNYSQTRTMQKFTVDTDDPTRWQPTPPAYMDGIEPHWSKIRPFVLDSTNQFAPVPPPAFSMEKDSEFYREVMEIYDVSKEMILKGDDSKEMAMAKFWDCNPYVSVVRGHLMFA